MIPVYRYDEQGLYVGSVEADPDESLPPRSTSLKPPKTSGSQVAQWAGGVWAILPEAPVSESDLNVLRLKATEQNNLAYDAAMSLMTADYPAAEIQTWERQRAEVVAWAEDHTAETPWITIAAATRGIDRDEYLARTLAKVNAFAQASAYLTGRRQFFCDRISAATTAEQLAAVTLDYSLPGA